MFCKHCGKVLDDNSQFCSHCGQRVIRQSAQPQERPVRKKSAPAPDAGRNRGRYRKQQKSSIIPLLCGAVVILLCGILIYVGIRMMGITGKSDQTDHIPVVQNGYLGVYTDITVRNLLRESIGQSYTEEVWDGGATDEGAEIVEVRFFNRGSETDAAIVQFAMLNDQCFKVITYIDPSAEKQVRSSEDLYTALQYQYIGIYAQKNQLYVDQESDYQKLVAHISQAPVSAIKYGAAANYSGVRQDICRLEGLVPTDMEVVDLINRIGTENPTTPETQPTQAAETTPGTIPMETAPLPTVEVETEPTQEPDTSDVEPLVGYVIERSGGLNVRNGPGLDYAQVGRLEPNEQVTILETQQVGQYTWGKIFNGWIRMDYITDEEPTGGGTSGSSSVRTGYVIESSGGLKVRSGPGQDYAEIGRLAPNDQITVYEFTVIGTSNWGRIGEGQWICTDYVVFSDNAMYSTNSLSFNSIPKEYTFTSGAGGWGTNLTIANDGSFTGNYCDSEMGDVGEGYPSGTVYYCNFSGKFSTPIKVNDYTYKMKLATFAVADVEGYEYIQNEIRYIASGPYGFDWFNEYYIYLPGIPSSMMPHSVSEWLSRYNGYDMDAYKMYVICSAKGELPFVGMQD